MGSTTAEVMVAKAVADAVQRAGMGVASEPRRIRGMVSDVLGAEARTRRAEIDAVVFAASESIPERLMSKSIDDASAVTMLTSNGLDVATADFAVKVWSYALGLLEAEAQPPTLTASVEATSMGADVAVDSDDEPALDGPAGQLDEPVRNEAPYPPPVPPAPQSPPYTPPAPPQPQFEPPAPPMPPAPNDLNEPASPTKNKAVLVGAIGVVGFVLAVVVIGALIRRPSNDAKVPVVKPVSVEFTDVASPVGTVSRTWTIEDGNLVAKVDVANRTDKTVTGHHYEVVPKSLAKSASLITSTPKHTVIDDDPVIAWEIALGPGKHESFKHSVKVGDKAGAEDLNKWKADQLSATKEFATELAAKPALEITSPAGQQLTDTTFTLTGTTDPTSTVEVAGAKPAVAADGSWSQLITGLGAGDNALTIVATSRFGVTTSVSYTVAVTVPEVPVPPADPTPTDTTTPADHSSDNKNNPGKTTPPKTGTTTTTSIATTTTSPARTPLKLTLSGPQTWNLPPGDLVCNYTFTVSINIPWSSIVWSGGSYYNNKTSATFSTEGLVPGTGSVKVTVTSRDGQTESASVPLTFVPGTPHAC